MSQKAPSVKIDFTGGMLVFGILVLIILFWGEPDLHDAILHRLMGPQAEEVQTPSLE